MSLFTNFLGTANTFLYSKFLIVLLVATGLYFTVRTRFVQFRMLPEAFHVLLEKSNKGSLSSFQALMIATASRVGTGNIAGVTAAIVAGGPGAVFWMWLMAVIGSASAFIESTLAQVYKTKDGEQGFKGGPAYYIQTALHCRWLGVLFSILLVACFAFGFNGLQSFNLTSSFRYYISDFDNSILPTVIGAVVAALAGLMFFGGGGLIGKISSLLVPVMAVLYILVGLFIFFTNLPAVPATFAAIFRQAFDFQAIWGAFAGSCVVQGIKRGLFSNEAGMGSAPNAAAAADVTHPAKQGFVQVLSVFIDTLVLCSTTAFIILLGGLFEQGGTLDGIPLVQQSVALHFGQAGIHFMTISICLFAFTSLIGNYFYSEANIKFISDNKALLLVFRLFAIVMVFIGSQMDLTTAWDLADVLMGLMATVNIVAILLLGNTACKVLRDYERQKAQGHNPVFHASDVGIDETEFWK